MSNAQTAIRAAKMRLRQDEIIEGYRVLWDASDLHERRKLPYKLISEDGPRYLLKDRKGTIIADLELIDSEGYLHVWWIRSLTDLLTIRDAVEKNLHIALASATEEDV